MGCKLINIKGQNSRAEAWQIPHQLFIVAVKPETLGIYSHAAHGSPGSCLLSPPPHFKQCKIISSPDNICFAFAFAFALKGCEKNLEIRMFTKHYAEVVIRHLLT